MKKIAITLIALAILLVNQAIGQNTSIPQTLDSKDHQIIATETHAEYSVSRYKNVDFQKIYPLQLKAEGLHTDIYISNTKQGVIIISSLEANKALKEFSHMLELNPSYYETLTRQDTTINLLGNNSKPAFDFIKASSINHDYKNAFNYTVDPRTGVSWSKGNYDEINVKGGKGYGQLLYDLIIWAPKAIK
jgi:hypothetical protein